LFADRLEATTVGVSLGPRGIGVHPRAHLAGLHHRLRAHGRARPGAQVAIFPRAPRCPGCSRQPAAPACTTHAGTCPRS